MKQHAAELMHNYLYKTLEALLLTVIQTDKDVKHKSLLHHITSEVLIDI